MIPHIIKVTAPNGEVEYSCVAAESHWTTNRLCAQKYTDPSWYSKISHVIGKRCDKTKVEMIFVDTDYFLGDLVNM